jgi:putative ubiquitin-RnfH superfamily antitoxin RatB of RatAB toxin-antitoxin module
MEDKAHALRIEVCYAHPEFQFLREVIMRAGATIAEAIHDSGIAVELNDVDLESCKVGIYGKIKAMETSLRDGDRIEIYRPLLADPKETRRRRAQKKN